MAHCDSHCDYRRGGYVADDYCGYLARRRRRRIGLSA
jgi:hypothetical protein